MRVAIVGAGISGLTAAYDLQKDPSIEVTVFEQAAHAGGKLLTARQAGYLIEQGPDSIFSVKPWANELIEELAMAPELIEPTASQFSMLVGGTLHSVPRGLVTLGPDSPEAVRQADFLSEGAKERFLQEATIPKGTEEEESVAAFFRRRFGSEFSRKVSEPLFAGTHAGEPENLSMAALYPRYLAMERTHGSLTKAAEARPPSIGAVGFKSLRGGIGALTARLAETLTEVHWRRSTQVTQVHNDGSLTYGESKESFDHIVLTSPANTAADLLEDGFPEAARELSKIRFVSTAIVTLAYDRSAFPEPPEGTGFLVATGEEFPLSGCTWSSNKWAGCAPDGDFLLRAFINRNVDKGADEQLRRTAKEAIATLLGTMKPPKFERVDRWTNGMPQYQVGHLTRLQAIDQALGDAPITLIGASYRGNSIPDCVHQARLAAAKLLNR